MAKLADVKSAVGNSLAKAADQAGVAYDPASGQTEGDQQLVIADDGGLVPASTLAENVEAIATGTAIGKVAEKESIPKAVAKPAKGNPAKGASLGAAVSVENEKINVCYYGPEGTAKTTNAAHLAKLGRVLYVNAESGLIARRLRTLGVPIENIVVWPDPKTGETITYEGLEQLFWNLKGDLLEDGNAWAGVIWDSATEILNAVLEQVVAKQVEKASRAGKDRDPFFTDISDYGTMTSQMRLLLRRFRDLPCHFAITALERRDTDDDGAVQYGPQVTPALMADIAGYVGVLIHTEVKEIDGVTVFSGRTAPGTKYRAKDRFGMLPRLMAVPTLDRVIGYVNDEISADSDPLQQAARAAADAAKAAEEARKAAGEKKTSRAG